MGSPCLFLTTVTRTKDYIVQLSDFRPPLPSPYNLDHQGYRYCGQYEGTPLAGEKTYLECNAEAIGRYLYIRLPNSDYMTICEVFAYGLRKYIPNDVFITWTM